MNRQQIFSILDMPGKNIHTYEPAVIIKIIHTKVPSKPVKDIVLYQKSVILMHWLSDILHVIEVLWLASWKTRNRPLRLILFHGNVHFNKLNRCLILCSQETFASPKDSFEKSVVHLSVVNQDFNGTLKYLHPLAIAIKNSIIDTYTLKKR